MRKVIVEFHRRDGSYLGGSGEGLQMCNRGYFGGGADGTWWWIGCWRTGMSINGLPTLTLSTIIKANVYLMSGIIGQWTGTFSWGSYNPHHTLVCTFQAVGLARAVSTQKGCLFSTGYSQNGAVYSPSFVTLTITLKFRKSPGPQSGLWIWCLSWYS